MVSKDDLLNDLGCAEWNLDDKTCKACPKNWIVGTTGTCVPVNDECRGNDADGHCTGCYKGYNLVDGACELAPNQVATFSGCHTWDWDTQVCL